MSACLKHTRLVCGAIAAVALVPLGIQAQAPARVVASETAPGVITVTWSPVPGASEYFIGRSVWPEGFRRAGTVKDTIYVDTAARAGVRHTYTVNVVGSPQRARSNEVIPAGSSDTRITGGAPRGPVGPRVDPEPGLQAPDSLLTPTPDTISGARCSAEANRKAQERRTAARRIGRDSVAMPGHDSAATEKTPVERAYVEGKCLSPGSPGYPGLWYPVAEKSGLTYEEQVRAWRQINIIALAYKHLLQREPTADETRREITALQRGKHWKDLWRQLAHSAERDERFGYFAPAPLASRAVARIAFGLRFNPTPEMCFGGLGPRCNGTVPDSRVEPKWFGRFRLPDGTEMGYVALGVAVGSILHDNACLADQQGLNCSGLGAGDLWKHKDWPAALEWNKASWNVLDGRTWREVFGPYPTARALQDQFFDDLRPVSARAAYLAPILSMGTIPVTTIRYTGSETKRTRALRAPPGTSLDDRDAAFCASGAFRERGSFPGKSSWGFCR